MEENELKLLAAQLRKPSGEDGEKVGARMFENNISMIRGAIDLLPVKEGDRVIEVGYGNGAHLDYIFQKYKNIRYTGVDISETMQKEAVRKNQDRVEGGVAEFLLGDGIIIPVEDSIADQVFTVNTIYFWDNHSAVLQEILRILKPGGSLCIALAGRNFMEKLPFTKHGFRLFSSGEVQDLLEKNGFIISQCLVYKEILNYPFQAITEREVVLILAKKLL